jgi:hypothetical protein
MFADTGQKHITSASRLTLNPTRFLCYSLRSNINTKKAPALVQLKRALCFYGVVMSCKGCGQKSKLIKAHIIPEAFFTGLRDGEKAPRILSNTPGVYPKKSPIGVYDQNILCRVCEDKFQQLDDYGYRVLIGSEDNHEILYQESGEIKGYKFHGVDNNLLKLFFISILWRASISTHSFYSKVELGELEELAQQSIWNMDPLDSHSFSFVL